MAENTSDTGPFSATSSPVARIIIVCFNSASVLPGCLRHLAAQTRGDFEVVIVNNDPGDENFSEIELPDSRFHILEPGRNLGFAQGSNFGAEGARTDWVITLNPDAYPAADWFSCLMAGAARHPEAAALGSALISADDPSVWDGLGDCYSIFGIAWRGAYGWPRKSFDVGETDRRILSPCGAAAAYRRPIFEAHGGFDPEYFCYLEDLDLGLRLALAGGESVLIAQAEVLHLGGHSTAGKNPTNAVFSSEFALYHSHRNAIRLLVKTMPGWLLPIAGAAFVVGQIWLLLRTAGQPHAAARRKGLRAGMRNFFAHWRARRAVRRTTNISAVDFSRKITWSPKELRRKTPVFWKT